VKLGVFFKGYVFEMTSGHAGWGSDIEGRKTNMQSEAVLDKDWIGRGGGREEVLVYRILCNHEHDFSK
jgi:hypothetical protein